MITIDYRCVGFTDPRLSGLDLEMWDVVGTVAAVRPEGVPHDAVPSGGYIDAQSQRHWVFTRSLPRTRTCGALGRRP